MKTRFTPRGNLIHESKLASTLIPLLGIVLALAACSTPFNSESTPVSMPTSEIISTVLPTATRITPTTSAASSSATPFICDENWQVLPVIPTVTDFVRKLYQQGIMDGNNPYAFSKIGDGEISTEWFLADFDLGIKHYNIGEYQNLKAVIENFQGSFSRIGFAARRGFNTELILDPTVNDPSLCNSNESPLECELRIHKPSIIILSLGTNQVHRPEEFESGMRQILNILIAKKVLPILSTKGDNLEGDFRINRIIACRAQEYQLPLWNFWAAIQPLPYHGLQSDLEHLTYYGSNDFTNPPAMQSAWTIRNLTALQVLDAVWQSVK
jgi:hypothetical protein